MWARVEVVDEPVICSNEENLGFISPIHSLPLRAVEGPVEPQLMETSPVKWGGLLLAAVNVLRKEKNSKAIETGYRFIASRCEPEE